MADLVHALNDLSRVFPTTTMRVVVTVVVAAVCGGSVMLAWRAQDELASRGRPLAGDVLVSLTVLSAAAAVTAVTSGVWSHADLLASTLAQLAPGSAAAPRIVLTLAIFASAVVFSRVARRVIDDFLRTSEAVSDHQREITYRVTQLTLWTAAIIVVFGLWQLNLGGLLVGAGFLGIVVGMAARQTLGAILAGFVLMFARPFEIGDWVQIGEQEGIVTDISIVNTRIQTFDGEYVMIPNDAVSGSVITNRTRKGRLRLEVEVGVDYAADVETAAEIAEEAMKDVETILTVPTPQVVAKRFGDSAVVLGLRFWIDKPSARRKWRARTAVVGAVKAAFEREDVKIPFPQRELSGRAETGGFRITGEGERVEARASADGGEE